MKRMPLVAVAGLALLATALSGQAAAGPPRPDLDRPKVVLSKADVTVDKKTAALAADRVAAIGLDKLRKGPDESYDRIGVNQIGRPGKAFYHVKYERTYKKLPVVGGGAVVVTDEKGNVLETSGIGPTKRLASVTPKVSKARATATAKTKVADVDTVDPTRLVVLAEPGRSNLAWETVVRGSTAKGVPSVLHVFTDARTGKVLETVDDVRAGTGNGYYNGQEDIDTSGSSGNFQMSDPGRSGLRCGGQNGSTYTDADNTWGNGQGTDLVTACVDAMYAGQRQGDALRNWMNYNGVNGNGGFYPARVGLNQVNAFWNGSYANFGHSQDNQRQATPIDVVAHEFGHGVFQFAGSGGSGSGAEVGGMNESTGDIMGAIAEHYAASQDGNGNDDPPDYLVGEEVGLITAGRPIRNMYNPSLINNDPNCYTQLGPGTEVHAGAGPQNHWFYLVAEGSNPPGGPSSPICSGGPSSVTGIGIQKASAIFMSALDTKASGWNHRTERAATLAAAKRLYPGSCVEHNTVQAAWNAIAVPAGAGESCTPTGERRWSMTLNPTSGSTVAGGNVSTTVGTQTTSGTAQNVTFSASGLPSGATASFQPGTVSSGNPSTLTITTDPGTAIGSYQVTVSGDGETEDHTATYTLRVTGPGDDQFSMSLNPTSATVNAGQNATSTVSTQTTSGDPQTVTFRASGLPAGATVSFNPASVQSGASSTMTITTSSSTPEGTSNVTVTGDGASEDQTASFQLTVRPTAGTCGGLPEEHAGTLSGTGAVAIEPNGTYWQARAGTFRGCLDGPDGVDFDLYLRKWNGSAWVTVAAGETPAPDENVTYNGTAGYYYWRIVSYRGSGAYSFAMNRP